MYLAFIKQNTFLTMSQGNTGVLKNVYLTDKNHLIANPSSKIKQLHCEGQRIPSHINE